MEIEGAKEGSIFGRIPLCCDAGKAIHTFLRAQRLGQRCKSLCLSNDIFVQNGKYCLSKSGVLMMSALTYHSTLSVVLVSLKLTVKFTGALFHSTSGNFKSFSSTSIAGELRVN